MLFESITVFAQIYRTYGGVIGVAILILQVTVLGAVLAGNGSVGHKVVWALVVLLLPVIGLILYVFFGRSPQDRRLLE
jgi:hypothetical protein